MSNVHTVNGNVFTQLEAITQVQHVEMNTKTEIDSSTLTAQQNLHDEICHRIINELYFFLTLFHTFAILSINLCIFRPFE